MVSCKVQILLWVLVTILITILLTLIIMYFYIRYLENSIINRYNANFDQFCQNLPSLQYRIPVYIPYQNGVYEQDLSIALIDIAFATSDANCTNILPIPDPPGLPNQLRIEGYDPITGNKLMYAYIFWSRKSEKVVISFTGTEYISEWQSDFQYEQIAPTLLNGYENGVLVHRGFYDIYISIRNQLWGWWNENYTWVKNFYITGHSLGGALSTICGYDFADVFDEIKPIHYSFAAPRSGNVDYATIFNQRLPTSLRINNTEDVVPQLPPSAFDGNIYEQTGGNVPFTISLGSLEANHSEAYDKYMPVCPQVSPCYIDTYRNY
jgi:hypothetical protein